eukprot:SAG11_NODE_1602_length_4600_cov_1.859587_6_plen_57_part_00
MISIHTLNSVTRLAATGGTSLSKVTQLPRSLPPSSPFVCAAQSHRTKDVANSQDAW